MAELKLREGDLKAELARLQASVVDLPTVEEVRQVSEVASRTFRERFRMARTITTADGTRRVNLKFNARVDTANYDYNGMSWEEARELVQLVFAGTNSAGDRYGVRVELPDGQGRKKRKHWHFHLTGRLINQWGTAPAAPYVPGDPDTTPDEFQGGPEQMALLEGGTRDSWH
jgi:hypothetical protein